MTTETTQDEGPGAASRRRPGARRAAGATRWLPWLAPLLLLVTLGSWALASPVASSPDDDFHLASIWCAAGDRPGVCEPGSSADSRRVAAGLARDAYCYQFHPELAGQCGNPSLSELTGDPLLEDKRGNFTGLYPPVFYATMSTLAGHEMFPSVVLMRLANVVLFVALLSAVVALVPPRLRTAVVTGVVATMVPLGIFLIPSTNPSSWALISAATLWPALLGFVEDRSRRRWWLAALAVVSVVVGAGARADAAAFAVLAVALVLVLTARRGLVGWRELTVLGVVVLLAAAFYLSASQGGQIESGLAGAGDAQDVSRLHLLIADAQRLPELWAGMLGSWGLGWLDTPLHASAWVLGLGVFGALTFWGLTVVDLRKAMAATAAFGAFCAVPLVLLVQSHAFVGSQVQPRYILPLALIMVGVAALPVRGRGLRLSWLQAVVVVAALGTAQSSALHDTMRRYVTGNSVGGWNLDVGVRWWWSTGPSPMVTWVVGTVAFAALLAVLAVLGTRGAVDVEPDPAARQVAAA